MPPTQEERTLLTLFADVHYLLTPRTHRPAHHRFERGSYFYLYTHLATQSSRIEIANNPGTPHQDAVAGALASSSVSFSYKQPSLVSFTLNPAHDTTSWQIKDYSLEHAQDFLYPLHGVDVYFWTERDAARFIDACKALPQGVLGALDIQGKPPPQPLSQSPAQTQPGAPQHQQQRTASTASVPLSPVVQKLEQAAITPAYGHTAQQRDSVSTIASTQQPQYTTATQPPSTSLPPPPPTQPHQSPHLQRLASPGTHSVSPPSSAGFSPPPLPYNPAAPAAPETRTHREKTPPPPEDPPGAAPAYAVAQPFAPHRADSGLYSAPTPPVAAGRVNSLPFSSYGAQGQTQGAAPSYLSSFAGPPSHPVSSPPPGSPSPVYTPTATPQQHQYSAHAAPPQYPTSSTQPQSPGSTPGYFPDAAQIHATAYRPSEADLAAQGKNSAPGLGGPGKVGRFDRGVDRFLKKLDKSWS